MSQIVRFQVWLVKLNPTQGTEISKTRPCVVISPNEMAGLSTALVAPLTTKGFKLPCRIRCNFEGKNGLILLDQIRAVDKSRLVKKLGNIDKSAQLKLCKRLQELFAY